MARRKKTPEAPKIEMGAEIFASLRELEKLKGIPVDYMLERLKQAYSRQVERQYPLHTQLQYGQRQAEVKPGDAAFLI